VKSSRTWKCEFGSGLSPFSMAKASIIVFSRVAELEQENARLHAIAQKSASQDGNARELMSEIEQLRARLAAAEQRERELSSQLSTRPLAVKTELSEPRLPTSPVRHPVFPAQLKSSDKTSASLSLLVLLCALPSIFSVSTTSQSAVPMSGSFPLSNTAANVNSAVASKMDFRSFLPRDSDWRSPGTMDLDMDHRVPRFSPRKLEFVDADPFGLRGLDITFDTEPSANGKIRVRIHNPSSVSSSSTSSSPSSFSPSPPAFNFDEIPTWSVTPSPVSSASPPVALLPAPQLDTDPFIGVGLSNQELGFNFDPAMLFNGAHIQSEMENSRGRRRVRIALKSPPSTDGSPGEWEVELC